MTTHFRTSRQILLAVASSNVAAWRIGTLRMPVPWALEPAGPGPWWEGLRIFSDGCGLVNPKIAIYGCPSPQDHIRQEVSIFCQMIVVGQFHGRTSSQISKL